LEKPKKTSANSGMKEHNDSLSYAIGLDMGMRMELEYKDVNHKMLNKGIDDYFSQNQYALTDKERAKIIKKYSEETQPKYRMDLEKNNLVEGKKFLEQNLRNEGVIAHRSGIQYKVITPMEGDKPGPKDVVKIHYIGKLIDGTTFDNSYTRGEPAVFELNRIFPGFSQGIQLMSPGATYQIFVPSHLGFSMQEDGPGGPGAVMIFQIDLLEIIPSSEENNSSEEERKS
jgi:FKBP-type peptidyl-prolyl cis-trans isomerase